MPKTMMITAFAAMLAASPAALAAQTAATPAPAAAAATRIEPGQLRATDLKGADVYDSQDHKIASIKDLVLDHGGRVAAVVLDVDGKNVGIGMNDLKIAMDNDNKPKKIIVNMSKDQLKSAQAFQLNSTAAGSGSSTPSGQATIPPANRSK